MAEAEHPTIPYVLDFQQLDQISNLCAWFKMVTRPAYRWPDGKPILGTYSCHAPVKMSSIETKEKYIHAIPIEHGFTNFTTLTYDDPKKPESSVWYDFILGPDSPWRSVIPEGSFQKVMKAGRLFGIDFLTDEFCRQDPVAFYNFLIATRQPYDGYGAVQSMYAFHKADPELSLADAYILGVIFSAGSPSSPIPYEVVTYAPNSCYGGWHTPLCNRLGGHSISPTLFRNGTPVKATLSQSNDIWNTKDGMCSKKDPSLVFKGTVKAEVHRRFGGVDMVSNGMPIREAINRYKELYIDC